MRTFWQLISLDDVDLEAADVVEMNLSVERGIPSLKNLDVARYVRIVDEWTHQFRSWLPMAEGAFQRTPMKWKNDIRFFRVGTLAGFLGHELGIGYIDQHKYANEVSYNNPSELFLDGLIDTRTGTCANMAALHVAISRKMGWQVSLACVGPHFVSRYDDGTVIHNIECTKINSGAFCSEDDNYYVSRHNLTSRAIECGSDLRRLTAREMMGVFIASRARHFRDVGDMDRADRDYAMARVLFAEYRYAYINSMVPMLERGARLFEPHELGHPNSLLTTCAPERLLTNISRDRRY